MDGGKGQMAPFYTPSSKRQGEAVYSWLQLSAKGPVEYFKLPTHFSLRAYIASWLLLLFAGVFYLLK